MTKIARTAFVIFIGLLPTVAKAAVSENSFAIRNVRVFDGEHVLPRANVVVRDGIIQSVGRNTVIPADVPVVEGAGETLLPGLIDSHVHVFRNASADALRFGVTTELDMFDSGNELADWKRRRSELARSDQADVWAAGLGVTAPGGAPLNHAPPESHIPTLASSKDAIAFVDARVAEGSDYIKVFIEDLSEYKGAKRLPTLSREEVCTVIRAAHADGKLAIVHVQTEASAREAIECEADGLAHMFPDRIASSSTLTLARSKKIFVQTTDSVWAGASALNLARQLASDPRVAPYLSASQKDTLLAVDAKPVPTFFPNAVANTRLMHTAGIPLLAGTDAPNEGTAHGVSLHQELQIFVLAGYTPQEALNAATALPAKIFRLQGRGRVVAGYRADLLLTKGDPTHDIADTLSIDRIWKNGYLFDRESATNHNGREASNTPRTIQ